MKSFTGLSICIISFPYLIAYVRNHMTLNRIHYSLPVLFARKNRATNDVEEFIARSGTNITAIMPSVPDTTIDSPDKIIFPEMEQVGIDEKKLRQSPFGKILFGVLEKFCAYGVSHYFLNYYYYLLTILFLCCSSRLR